MSFGNITVRAMQARDLEQVHLIDQLSFPLPWPASSFLFELNENRASRCWVAEINGPQAAPQVVGAIVVWLIFDEAHIATIAVHPDYRRQGIGRLLLKTALVETIQMGAVLSTLEVRSKNLAAQALYREFGFEVVGSRKSYYQDDMDDALIMTVFDLDQDYIDWLDDDDQGVD